MANVSNLSASVAGNTVTLTWTNPSLPFNSCQPSPYDYPHRTWRLYRDGVLIWSEMRNANHASPNGRTSYSETVADGTYLYEVELFDEWGMFNALDQCQKQSQTGARVGLQVGVNVADTTPDPFDFGPDIFSAGRGTEQISYAATITGIDAPSPISITGDGSFYAINGGPWTTAAGTVNQGDKVQLKIIAASTFSTTRTATVTIGGIQSTWSVTTGADAAGPIITLQTAPPISLHSDVRALFGPAQKSAPTPPPASLSEYMRAGAYVPDISANNAVPIAPPISLTDLLGAGFAFKFAQEPSGKSASLGSAVGNTTNIGWSYGTDFWVNGAEEDAFEFWWNFTLNQSHPKITITSQTTQSWSNAYYTWAVTGRLNTALAAGEVAIVTGSVTLKIRPIRDTTKVIQTTTGFSFAAASLT